MTKLEPRTDTPPAPDEGRLQDAEWTTERVWRRTRYAVITVINLAVLRGKLPHAEPS